MSSDELELTTDTTELPFFQPPDEEETKEPTAVVKGGRSLLEAALAEFLSTESHPTENHDVA